MEDNEPDAVDPLTAEAERLERAYADHQARKTEAAELAARHAPEAERLRAAWARIDSLPPGERSDVLASLGKPISSALRPLRPAPPPPERQIRGGFSATPPPVAKSPRWTKWLNLPNVELWEAVLLSLGIEPVDALREVACAADSSGQGFFRRLPGDFYTRRKDCSRVVGFENRIRPQGSLYGGMLSSPRCKVRLQDVARFLIEIEYEVPEQMVPPNPERAVESNEKRQCRRLQACRDAGLDMSCKASGRLPDGVRQVADAEGVTRQSFSADVKAALKREQEGARHGRN